LALPSPMRALLSHNVCALPSPDAHALPSPDARTLPSPDVRALPHSAPVPNASSSSFPLPSAVVDRTRGAPAVPLVMWNMDETPLWLDMPYRTTIESKGARRVPCATTGSEKKRVTVVLCASQHGQKMPPCLIVSPGMFSAADIARAAGNAARTHVTIMQRAKSFMSSDLMCQWTQTFADFARGDRANGGDDGAALGVEQAHVLTGGARPLSGGGGGGGGGGGPLLIMDSCPAHISAQAKAFYRERALPVAVIPGGLTSTLQPLDLTVNRSFKAAVRRLWHAWMQRGDAALTSHNNARQPGLDQVVEWVKTAWDEVSADIIANGFRKAGLTGRAGVGQ